jgi:SpoIID/LytB domain protein
VGQSAADGFKEPVAPLVEQNVGALCSGSPKYTWGPVVVSKKDLTERMRGWAASRGLPQANMAPVYSVEVQRMNRFGRPVQFRVTDSRGQIYSLSGEEMRWAVNFNAPDGQVLWSSFVGSIVNESDRVRFIGGRGHGHGVGLCQWCTQARALAGIRHEDILAAAYPGARLLRAY